MDVYGYKTAPSLSEALIVEDQGETWWQLWPDFLSVQSQIVSAVYSPQTPNNIDQAPTFQVFSHSLSIVFSLAPSCFSTLNHHQ